MACIISSMHVFVFRYVRHLDAFILFLYLCNHALIRSANILSRPLCHKLSIVTMPLEQSSDTLPVNLLQCYSIYKCMCAWMCFCMYVCICVSRYICMYVCMYVCSMKVCMYGCTNVCMSEGIMQRKSLEIQWQHLPAIWSKLSMEISNLSR